GQWFPASDWASAPGVPCYEQYPPDTTACPDSPVKLYVPVVPRRR
ncbi:MAG: GyrI-like domain-containing protein, partial [Planctomycetes bacterium]|nr:GyrI-like domain-containing protein [Planctomycetota bacterium]